MTKKSRLERAEEKLHVKKDCEPLQIIWHYVETGIYQIDGEEIDEAEFKRRYGEDTKFIEWPDGDGDL